MNRNLFALKLFLSFILISMLALGGSYMIAKKSLDQIIDREEIKNAQFAADIFTADLGGRLNFLKNETIALANNPQAKKLAVDFTEVYEKLGLDAEILLGKKYVEGFVAEQNTDSGNINSDSKNIGAAGEENVPENPVQGAPLISPEAEAAVFPVLNTYDAMNNVYQPVFIELSKNMALQDIMIIDAKGNVIFSYAKGKEFATNVLNGKWQDTRLGKIVADARTLSNESAILYDSKPYEQNPKENSALLASPIKEGSTLLGVAVMRFTLEPYVKSIDYGKALKEQENIYVISSDNSIAYSVNSSPAANIKNIEAATIEKPIVKISPEDNRVYGKNDLEFLGSKWQVVSELNLNARERESLAAVNQQMVYKFAIAGAIAFVLSLILAFIFARLAGAGNLSNLAGAEWTVVNDLSSRAKNNMP